MSVPSSLNIDVSNLLFPNIVRDYDQIISEYPKRNLEKNPVVTRFAPSPTGFMHIGSIYSALISERFAHSTLNNNNLSGIFYLRIEDTDEKREVHEGINKITESLKRFGISYEEGCLDENNETGLYGPYKQSMRKDIYAAFAKRLIDLGKAYPCFMTPEEIDLVRKEQEKLKIRPGIYGDWAKNRSITLDELRNKLSAGVPFVIRLKSSGTHENRIRFSDLIKGDISYSENDVDYVLLKSDGLPTYHFAHVVDDYLMGTTHVIRADEWLPSLPVHIEIFDAFGFTRPHYAHISPIMKFDNGGKRKLSKRKDPEANVEYYYKEGYPVEGVIEYLMNVANSSFEEWRRSNPALSYKDFEFQLDRMNVSGALFDLVKLLDVCKEYVSGMTPTDILLSLLAWCEIYDLDLREQLLRDTTYTEKVLGLERFSAKSRKDLGKWSDFKPLYFYFFDHLYELETHYVIPDKFSKDVVQNVLISYSEVLDLSYSREAWFEQMKFTAEKLGFASDNKKYKESPSSYLGSLSEFAGLLRLAITKRDRTPELFDIIQILGKERVVKRLTHFQ